VPLGASASGVPPPPKTHPSPHRVQRSADCWWVRRSRTAVFGNAARMPRDGSWSPATTHGREPAVAVGPYRHFGQAGLSHANSPAEPLFGPVCGPPANAARTTPRTHVTIYRHMCWYAAGLFTMIGGGGVEVVIWTPFSQIWTSSRGLASRCRTRWTGREAPRGISAHAPHMWQCGDVRAGQPGTAVRPGAPGTCAGRRLDDDSKPLQNTHPVPQS